MEYPQPFFIFINTTLLTYRKSYIMECSTQLAGVEVRANTYLTERCYVSNKTLVEDFLLYVEKTRNYSQQTIKYYKYVLYPFLEWLEKDITELSLEEADAYLFTRSLNPNSINTQKSVLRSFFMYVDRYRNIRLRFDYSMLKNMKVAMPEVKFLEVEQVQSLIKKLQGEDQVIAYTMFATGMRIGEVIKLAVEDIHQEEIKVLGKGGKRRVVPIPKDLERCLDAHIQSHYIRGGAIFRSIRGDPYTVGGMRKRLQKAFKKVGYTIHPHMFRHSIATALLRNGMDIRSVQTFLGHEHIQTTMRYTHVTNPHLRESYLKSYPQVTLQK